MIKKTAGERRRLDIVTLIKYGKVLIFVLLVAAEIVLAAVSRNIRYGNVAALWVILPVEVVLMVENAIKLWALRSFRQKIFCYVLDTLLLLVLTFFSSGELISILYIIILSEFYLSQEKLSGSIAMGVCSVFLFLVMKWLSNAFSERPIGVLALVSDAFSDLLILALHFLIINFALQVFRKDLEIDEQMEELNKRNRELREAYEKIKEVTALEERQRIAKEIHDTAGHSITTVIMQTEAAKLAIERDPADARRKIVAANLQAKHALEELREGVHLLSDQREHNFLRDDLLNIVHESTDGTDIAIRYDVDEISLCEAKHRFFCNALKEGISNGLRHGGATAFYFELKETGNEIRFLLSDNGCGTSLSALKAGFGLKGMLSHAESFGGSVSFETEEGDGFELRITLPADVREKREGKG